MDAADHHQRLWDENLRWHEQRLVQSLDRDGHTPCLPNTSAELAPKAEDPAPKLENKRSGDYRAELCDTPRTGSPLSTDSEESMHNHAEGKTPPESPKPGSPGALATANGLGRLSLESDSSPQRTSQMRRGSQDLAYAPATKRSASSELPRPPGRQSPKAHNTHQDGPPADTRHVKSAPRQARGRGSNLRQNPARSRPPRQNFRQSPQIYQHTGPKPVPPVPRDSGYGSAPSRSSTLQQLPGQSNATSQPVAVRPKGQPVSNPAPHPRPSTVVHLRPNTRFPGLILQPDSSPISQEQLASEVKGIYAGLVPVEAKCINIDAAQLADPTSQLGPEHWQALIALHRSLLYEHHDFLMATQHPSATPALSGLATKYSMPARMWKHGIHAFLEVLRHRRPDTQDYMLAFIYLAYQMMALLLETVPSFKDTWIECLGDLARYRMAIEEVRETHATWGAVAARWYTLASDRHPAIGRLNHHLGILERPSLRKYFLYAKSLTCQYPFNNARDSMTTLCTPIVQDASALQSGKQSAEAWLLVYHAQLYASISSEVVEKTSQQAILKLRQLPASQLRDISVPLIVANVAALLELGSATNALWQIMSNVASRANQLSRPSVTANLGGPCQTMEKPALPTTSAAPSTHAFCYTTFTIVLQHHAHSDLRDSLPSIHTTMVWLHCLHSIQTQTADHDTIDTCHSLMTSETFSWGGLAACLNVLVGVESISYRTMELARQGNFPAPERADDIVPLPEDYLIRGLIWTQFYFPEVWFSTEQDYDGEGRAIETLSTHKARVERVQWLGLYLAFRCTEFLQFNADAQRFSAPVAGPCVAIDPIETDKVGVKREARTAPPSQTSLSPTTTLSAHSDSDGNVVVDPRNKLRPAVTYASIASKPKPQARSAKARPDYNIVKVFDEEAVPWDQ